MNRIINLALYSRKGQSPPADSAFINCGDEGALREIASHSRHKSFKHGECIIFKGDEAAYVGRIKSGTVKLTSASASGRYQIVDFLYQSDLIGSVLGGPERFSYEAASDVEVCLLDRWALNHTMQSHPEVRRQLYLKALDELDRTRHWISIVARQTALRRAATFLYIVAEKVARQHGSISDGQDVREFNLPVSRTDIAAFLSISPETLSRMLQELVSKGVLQPTGVRSYLLLDKRSLIAATGEHLEDLDGLFSEEEPCMLRRQQHCLDIAPQSPNMPDLMERR